MPNLKDRLMHLLFPTRCPCCKTLLPDSAVRLCPDCERALPRTPPEAVFPLKDSTCLAPLYYEGMVRALVHRFKFKGARALAAPMAALMGQALSAGPARQFDLVTWVPVSRARLRQRGYDQARLLAAPLANLLGCPLTRTLHKTRNAPTQNALTDHSERRGNVAGAFDVIAGTVAGRRVLLVDDVLTTGATLDECVGRLYRGGALSVACVVFAKTRPASHAAKVMPKIP